MEMKITCWYLQQVSNVKQSNIMFILNSTITANIATQQGGGFIMPLQKQDFKQYIDL